MDLKGSKKVEFTGISDKQQITAVLSGSLAGEPVYGKLRFQATSLHVLPPPPLEQQRKDESISRKQLSSMLNKT